MKRFGPIGSYALLLCAAGAARAGAPFAQPMVSITFDDGFQSQFDLARPALNARRLKATYYLISQPIQQNWSDYLTLAEARALVAEGNEIGGHTVTHPHLPQLSAVQLDQELSNSKSWLQSQLGLSSIADFASPYGEFDDAVIARIKADYRSHRTQVMGRAFSDDDPYLLRAAYVRDTTTVAEIESWIDEAAVEGSWLILTFHEFTSAAPSRETQYPATSFAAVLDYLKARRIAVVTVGDGLSRMGKTQNPSPVRWIFGDWFGDDVEDWSWGQLDFRSTAQVQGGHSSIAFEASNWAGLAFHLLDGFTPSKWNAIEFWVNGGKGGGQQVELAIYGAGTRLGAAPVASLLGHPIAANSWQKVSVPLAKLGIISGTIDEIHLEDTSGVNQPTLYVDSMLLRGGVAPRPPPPPPPGKSAYVIYDDALRGGFEDWSWATHDLAETAVVRSGHRAASFVPDSWDAIYFHHSGVDTTGYSSIELYVNGGASGNEDIGVAVWDGSTLLGQVDVPRLLGHPLRPNTWEHVVVPFSDVGLAGRPLRDLYIQDDSGTRQSTVYVDDVHLIP